MEINITVEAEQYIRQNGQSATVMLGTMTGCCGGAAPLPQIHLVLPNDLSDYEQNKVKDITIFIDKRVDTNKQIHITLAKLLWLKKLSVELV
ncbi:CC/Se motif family (seleno)protein [Petroclostridium sp. X23]|uniref:CC/Se motif family (seleno)protein n=1 Tax=Petroclostridium sp. X23 TaxID=3045146 RepID=UPI0024AE7A4D|nr:CC/Se motif family (seleno)protein [Petroclostridium sp. X23]WHH59964.1 CC/Se motif family (seleno)protein [Petroclostridium sp. X23]